MTLTLLIIRHAKSSWEDPFADDHARVLNGRGRRSADALGDWLNGSGHVPDTCLCSDGFSGDNCEIGTMLSMSMFHCLLIASAYFRIWFVSKSQ